MKSSERWMWAVGILLVDMLIFAVPLTAVFAAYVLVTRPAWFKNWVGKIYSE